MMDSERVREPGADAPPRSPLVPLWAPRGSPWHVLAGRAALLAAVLAVLVITTVATVSAVKWIGKPFPGFLISERLVVSPLAQPDWPGALVGLTFPDRILAANDRRLGSLQDLEDVIRQTALGEHVRYRVERDGDTFEVTVATRAFTAIDFLMTYGLALLSGLAYFAIALIVFVLKPDTRASWAFSLACLFLSVYAITSFDIQSRLSIRLLLLANALFPAAFAHLAFVFPVQTRLVERAPATQLIPYALSAILLLPLELLYPRPLFMPFYQVVRMYALFGAAAMLVSALRAYFASPSVLARQRAKVVLFGAALAFPIPALDHLLTLFGDLLARVTIQNNLLTLPVLIFPASIAYAIAKHNLFDVDVYIKRAVGYGIMTAVVGTTYFAMQALTRPILVTPALGDYAERAYPIILALLVVFFFNPINRKVQEVVDRVFFRKQFDYKETISAVSSALRSMLDLDQILTTVVETIRKEMFVDTAGVILCRAQDQGCRTLFLTDDPEPGRHRKKEVFASHDDPLLALVHAEKTLITKYDIEEDPRFGLMKARALSRFSELAASLAIPLTYQGGVTGILALGYRKSGRFYTREDVELLETMADQAAVAIENATAHEEVVRYAAELEASLRRIQLLESMKANLAKFVPITVQQLIEEAPEAPLLEKREADLSVLFADITGYTRMSAQMELEQVNRIVERYFGAFLDEILTHGGDVNETAGDGLMVIFRDPHPGRHARAAALTALGIQRRAREINTELAGQSEPITMKVGVNSGAAAVGATKIEGLAGTRWTYTASGPTTNIAARLAALSEGGAVIISEETRRRIGEEFGAEDLGPQSLKNVPEPVRAFRLSGEEREPDARRPFVERRRHPRRPVSWPVRLWVGEEPIPGRAVDAGVYGILVAPSPTAPLKVGESYRVEIVTESGGEVTRLGEVRHLSDRGLGLETKDRIPLD